jgi:hypothetical protein
MMNPFPPGLLTFLAIRSVLAVWTNLLSPPATSDRVISAITGGASLPGVRACLWF